MDKAFLLIWGVVLVFGEEAKAAPVVAMLLGILAAAAGYVEVRVKLRAAGAILFAAGCFFLPELIFFLPVLFYDSVMERRLWWIFAAVPVLGIYYSDAGMEQSVLGIWVVSLAAGILLGLRSGRAEMLAEEMIRLRDTSTELNLVLREKNKDLLEKQDYEIYLATLRERNRIAREIHDNVGHMLSRSILQMGALSTVHKEEPLHGQLCSVNETLNLAMNSIRESVHDLHDDSIDLRQAVMEATREMSGEYQVNLDYDMSPEVPQSVKYCFIATVKEAVSNIVKHSDADRVTVILREHPGFYQLTVEDNGTTARQKGYSIRQGDLGRGLEGKLGEMREETAAKKLREPESGIGLLNMCERVEALHGTFRIHTENGFVVFISIPKANSSTTQ